MPGVAKDHVKVSIDGRVVKVEARAEASAEKKDGDHIVYRERSLSQFARSFKLPVELDQAASSAKLDNGVLTLTLAKRVPNGADATDHQLTAQLRERPARPHVEGVVRSTRPRCLRCSRIAAASAIMAPLSVHSASSG